MHYMKGQCCEPTWKTGSVGFSVFAEKVGRFRSVFEEKPKPKPSNTRSVSRQNQENGRDVQWFGVHVLVLWDDDDMILRTTMSSGLPRVLAAASPDDTGGHTHIYSSTAVATILIVGHSWGCQNIDVKSRYYVSIKYF